MKTLRDSNNNFSHIMNGTTQKNFSSHASTSNTQQNYMSSNGSLPSKSTKTDPNVNIYPSLPTHNHHHVHPSKQQQQQQATNYYRTHQDRLASTSKFTNQSNNNTNSSGAQPSINPLASTLNIDINQLTSMIQTYLTKLTNNQIFSSEAINPLFYLQLMNANTMFLQHVLNSQNNSFSTYYDPTKLQQSPNFICSQQHIDAGSEVSNLHPGRNSHILQADPNILVPKTRPMTQDEIAEHTRLVYQRALQRNQLQQQTDPMKYFYDSVHMKPYESSANSNIVNTANKSTYNNSDVPAVPNIVNMNNGVDVFDTTVTPPASCHSNKETIINSVPSSVSLVSADDTKMLKHISSTLDPSAPVFIPRHSQSKLYDDDNETSSSSASSSSDSDFNDFHFLDQFIEEFYNTHNEHDNHLIVRKIASSTNITNSHDELLNNSKCNVNNNILGQGDATEKSSCETNNDINQQPVPSSIDKLEYQYSIYELLQRYRNPGCHLILPEWSRLSVILPNVCSMQEHTYKIKRYFAYRRRLNENEDFNKTLELKNAVNISVQG